MTKIDKKENLTPAQMQAVNLLALGENITSVAEKLNVSRQTVSGWQNKDGNFQEALWSRQYELWYREIKRVRAMTSKALDVMYEALESEDFKERLAASKILLSTLGLPELVAKQFQPLQKEFWRPLTEKEKEEHINLMRIAGVEAGDLSAGMVKVS